MLSLKLIEDRDEGAVFSIAMEFFRNSPYRHMTIDEPTVRNLVREFIYGDKTERICITLNDGQHLVGCLAAIVTKQLFNKDKIAAEVIWYVYPEYRSYKSAKMLREAYEFWATKMGATSIQLVSVDDKDKLYKRWGYVPKETAYLKEV
jgi:GNAT superfamily N-acetyltransferase